MIIININIHPSDVSQRQTHSCLSLFFAPPPMTLIPFQGKTNSEICKSIYQTESSTVNIHHYYYYYYYETQELCSYEEKKTHEEMIE